MLTIVKAKLERPDSDGDMGCEVEVEFTNNSSRAIEYIISKSFAITSDGLLADSSSDENDDYIEAGDTWKGEVSVGYLKSYIIGNETPQIQIEMLGCACNNFPLGTFVPEAAKLQGLNGPKDLGDGITLHSLTVAIGKPDDDGDINIELRALLKNSSTSTVPRAVISGKLMRSGREVEEISNYSDPVPAEQMTVIEASSYVKQRQLTGANIEVGLSLFPVVARDFAEGAFKK